MKCPWFIRQGFPLQCLCMDVLLRGAAIYGHPAILSYSTGRSVEA
ncbi:MAG: hypothetical protein R6U56_08265 [Opitutales bacterium]